MKVGIIMGSKSDLDTMKKASAVLDEFKIPYEMVIASAPRTPEAVKNLLQDLKMKGLSLLLLVLARRLIYLVWWRASLHYLLSAFLLMQRL